MRLAQYSTAAVSLLILWFCSSALAAVLSNITEGSSVPNDEAALDASGGRFLIVPASYVLINVNRGNPLISTATVYQLSLDALVALSQINPAEWIETTEFSFGWLRLTVSGIPTGARFMVLHAAFGIWKCIDQYRESELWNEGEFVLLDSGRPVAFFKWRLAVQTASHLEGNATRLDQAGNATQPDLQFQSNLTAGGQWTDDRKELGDSGTLIRTPSWYGDPLPLWAWYMPLNSAIVNIMKAPAGSRQATVQNYNLFLSEPSYQFSVRDMSTSQYRNRLSRHFILAMCRSSREAGIAKLIKTSFRLQFDFILDGQLTTSWQLKIKSPFIGSGRNQSEADDSYAANQSQNVANSLATNIVEVN